MSEEPRILRLSEWNTSVTDLEERTVGTARLRRRSYRRGLYEMYGVKGYDYFQVVKPIPVTSLELRNPESGEWETWMVDDPPHWHAMETYAENSWGRVLCAGWGLGLVQWWLDENPKVRVVRTVERNLDVLDHLGRRNDPIYVMDFEDYLRSVVVEVGEATLTKYDRIIVDLWVAHGHDEVRRICDEEVVPLARRLIKLWPKASLVFHGFGNLWLTAYAPEGGRGG